MAERSPLGITELVLRDAHQSLLATRLRLEDMLPIAPKLDQVGYWSMESWGGATYDACIRYLGEDPWERIRELKAVMPNTPQQMLLRGQNLLGYRHYADDVVRKFVERAAINGVDVFRVFDAMNDMRNIETALNAVKETGKHAQGTMSYTVSPVHTMDMWVDMGKKLEDMGADSVCIKDMAGLLAPYVAFELVSKLKASLNIPVHMQSHATTGMSTATIMKCVEAGIDNVDTAISSMSMTYGHTATETMVAILDGSDRDTGLDMSLLDEIGAYFREVRKKYAQFEGSLRGVDSRILVAQVPGGMLTNMENQLKEQGAADKFDDVLKEIPKVRKDLGFIPLVTPTSQIVGTQSVINVLNGERYKVISKETAGVLRGEYGATPAAVDKTLQDRVLEGEEPITCRPADNIAPELESLIAEVKRLADEDSFSLAEGGNEIDDVLTYALFPQVGLKFLKNRGNPDAFEPAPSSNRASEVKNDKGEAVYTVDVDGVSYVVTVSDGGDITSAAPIATGASPAVNTPTTNTPLTGGDPVPSPLAGTIVKIVANEGQVVQEGDPLILMEAMKMETTVSAPKSGTLVSVAVKAGDAVTPGMTLVSIG